MADGRPTDGGLGRLRLAGRARRRRQRARASGPAKPARAAAGGALIPKAELGSVGTRLNLGPYLAQILANGWCWPGTAGQLEIAGWPPFTW
jgi:hypothetical protein